MILVEEKDNLRLFYQLFLQHICSIFYILVFIILKNAGSYYCGKDVIHLRWDPLFQQYELEKLYSTKIKG